MNKNKRYNEFEINDSNMYKTSIVVCLFVKWKWKEKKINSFRFSFCNLKGFCLLFHYQFLSSIIDTFVKNQKESEKKKKGESKLKMKEDEKCVCSLLFD
jgi:hypothetical protein